jgi:AmpD protein
LEKGIVDKKHLENFMMNSAGWLDGIRHVSSPNYNQRPCHCEIDTLVIHNISLPPNQFGGGYIEQFFTNTLDCSEHGYFQEIKGMKVSSHFLIARDGAITQFVPVTERAWHAGQSQLGERCNCNDFSIGIELEGADDILYTVDQYRALTTLTDRLMGLFPRLDIANIVGHSDIAPGRKTDPGPAFDWQHYKDLLTLNS